MGTWEIKKLSQIAEINPKESIKKGMIAKKVGMDKLIPFCRDILTYEIAEYSGGVKFRNGDTIMARITPCLENGKTAKVDILDKGEIGFGSTEYIVFRAKEGNDEDYLYYLICSSLVREQAIKSMVGSSGRQRVQTDVVGNLEIAVPPLHVQEKIGACLKVIDDRIGINNKINNNLEQQAQAIYQQMFIDNASSDWTEVTLSDIADITMGQSPSGSSYNEDGTGTIFFQGRAEFGFRFPTVRLFTTEPKRMAHANDTLMSVRAPVGDLNVAHNEIDLKNPKGNVGNAGFTNEERGKMTELLNSGFVDSYRYLYPDKKDAYTWWSYMFHAREKDIGSISRSNS